MSKNQRLRQRSQRREKRQIKAVLLSQSQGYDNCTPISRNINLPSSFGDYAIRETQRDIRKNLIEESRLPILEKAMELNKKIESKKQKARSASI